MNKCIILPFFLLLFVFSFAQQEATTTDGKKILIYPDGTWKPAQVETVSEIHPASIEHLELPRPNLSGQIITHTGYTLSYNPDFRIANWVAYELTAEETVAVVKRNDKFIPNPLLSSGPVSNADYKGSGYDPGASGSVGRYVLFIPNNGRIVLPFKHGAPESGFQQGHLVKT